MIHIIQAVVNDCGTPDEIRTAAADGLRRTDIEVERLSVSAMAMLDEGEPCGPFEAQEIAQVLACAYELLCLITDEDDASAVAGAIGDEAARDLMGARMRLARAFSAATAVSG